MSIQSAIPETPPWLGGHLNKTHIDSGALQYLIERFKIKTMIDVGCGPGGMIRIGRKKGLTVVGVDGDPFVQQYNQQDCPIIQHDYTKGKLDERLGPYDLAYSTEFLEHVEEKYLENVMDTFKRAKYALVTHALPGDTGGHHHVNLQQGSYWIDVFSKYGFIYDSMETQSIRSASTMHKGFMRKTGLFFIKIGESNDTDVNNSSNESRS